MQKFKLSLISKRTVLAIAIAGGLPLAAFAETGAAAPYGTTGSSGSMGSGASDHPMMNQAHHGAAASPTTGSAHKVGGRAWVKSIQAALNHKEHAHLAVDGKMGHETRTALEKFQKHHGLKPTGHPNKATDRALGM